MSSQIIRSSGELITKLKVNDCNGYQAIYKVGPLYIPPTSFVTVMAMAEVTCDWATTELPIGICWYIGRSETWYPMSKRVCQNITKEIHHMVLQAHSMLKFSEKTDYNFYFLAKAISIKPQTDITVEQNYGELIVRIDS